MAFFSKESVMTMNRIQARSSGFPWVRVCLAFVLCAALALIWTDSLIPQEWRAISQPIGAVCYIGGIIASIVAGTISVVGDQARISLGDDKPEPKC